MPGATTAAVAARRIYPPVLDEQANAEQTAVLIHPFNQIPSSATSLITAAGKLTPAARSSENATG